jgi:hypothetical protein
VTDQTIISLETFYWSATNIANGLNALAICIEVGNYTFPRVPGPHYLCLDGDILGAHVVGLYPR